MKRSGVPKGIRNNKLEDFSNDKLSGFDSLNDKDIWASFKKGNEKAFNFIYSSYFNELFSYGMRFTNNREIVKDSIQELFIELRKASEQLAATDNIRFYLFGALKKKILKLLKKESLITFGQVTDYEAKFDIAISHETKLINQQIDNETKERLQKAFNALTKREKEAVYYFYYQSMSYSEVAEIMNLKSAKQARNLIYKSLRVLRSEVIILGFSCLILLFFLFYTLQ